MPERHRLVYDRLVFHSVYTVVMGILISSVQNLDVRMRFRPNVSLFASTTVSILFVYLRVASQANTHLVKEVLEEVGTCT
jgi:hypothetical protein